MLVCTNRINTTLCICFSLNSSYIVEFNNSYLTCCKSTICMDEELVIPLITCSNFLFPCISFIVSSEPISLLALNNNLCRVRIDFDRLYDITLKHLECH